MKAKNVDILNGPLARNLLIFTLPIALCSIVQQLFNAADTVIVGRFASSNALAAVGTNTEIIALIVTVSSGLAIGANILIANLIGKNKREEMPCAVKSAMLMAVIIGILGLILGQIIANPLLILIKTPTEIFNLAKLYLRLYIAGYPFLLLYDFGSAILRANGDSRYPFIILLISGGANVLLNVLFTVGLHMGVAGVAIATDISNFLSSLLVILKLKNYCLVFTDFKTTKFSAVYGRQILRVGIACALQGVVFCFANIFVQACVNSFGKTAIAGSTIAMNFEYFTYYIITAFGQSATTFTCQNYASNQISRCKKIHRLCLAFSLAFSGMFILLIVIFKSFLSSLFSNDIQVIESAALRIMCILVFEVICCFYEIPCGVMRGCGYNLFPSLSTILGICVFRVVWIYTVFQVNHTLRVLYFSFPLSWVVTIIIVNLGFVILKKHYKLHHSL